jgi:hypothetical protein
VRPPSTFGLVTPVLSPSPTIDPSEPLTVEWSGSVPGTLHVVFDATEDRGATVVDTAVACEFAGSAGSGTVAAAALTELPLGPAVMRVFVRSRDTVNASAWLVATELWSFGTDASGMPSQGAVMIGTAAMP